jgi:hypothetical protein
VYLTDDTTLYRLRAAGEAHLADTALGVDEGSTALVEVVRSGDAAGPLSVAYRTVDGSALAGEDYAATSGTLAWPAGDTSGRTIAVPILDDQAAEETESFTVELLPGAPGDTGSPRVAEVTVADDDEDTPPPPPACVANVSTVCLLDGRFAVTARFRTETQPSRLATALPLTDDTGYFWFFSADNVELVVKVLDGCDVPGFDTYWVFAAGLTAVEVDLRVEDTATGEVFLHHSPLDTPFRPLQDTAAFATCDAE